MPTVLRWGPYRTFFYSQEGDEPAHVHVRAGEKETEIWLHDVTIAANAGFPAHEIGDIVRYIQRNRGSLLRAWHDYFGT